MESMIYKIFHDKVGSGYVFDYRPSSLMHWSWHQMVAQLDTRSMKIVVDGPTGRSGGLIGCSLVPRPGSYDHIRCSKMSEPRRRLPIWEFVLRRADGSAVRMKPRWGETKIGCQEGRGPWQDEEIPLPKKGVGQSDGPGTYRYYKNLCHSFTLRFDPKKKPGARLWALAAGILPPDLALGPML